jgi:hypothetical protein
MYSVALRAAAAFTDAIMLPDSDRRGVQFRAGILAARPPPVRRRAALSHMMRRMCNRCVFSSQIYNAFAQVFSE